MRTAVFKTEGVLTAGSYLHGQTAWLQDHWLDHADLVVIPPATGQCVIQLEISGALVPGARFTIGAGDRSREWHSKLALGLVLPAAQFARWKVVSFTGAPGDEAHGASITLVAGREEAAQAARLNAVLAVRWVSGFENLWLWEYDPAAHAFAEVSEGLADGRAGIEVYDSEMRVTIQNVPVLRAVGGVLQAGAFRSGALRSEPRLEFWIGDRRVGAVNADGLLAVGRFTQEAEVIPAGGFEFRGSTDAVVAHLAADGLRHLGLADGLA